MEPYISVTAKLQKWIQRGERKLLVNPRKFISILLKKGILSGCSAKTQDQNNPYNG